MKEYWDTDFYKIEDYGEKYICICGYFYDEGDGEGSKKTSRCIDFSGFECPLKEFLDWRGDEYEYDDRQAEADQYIENCTPKEAIKMMNTYFNGNPPTELKFEDITMETPCGYYVNA